MKNFFKKNPTLVFIGVFLLFLLIYVFSSKQRHFSNSPNILNVKSGQENDLSSSETETDEESKLDKNTPSVSGNTDVKISIKPADCDNECEKFKKDEELEYCRQVCGIETYYDYSEEKEDQNDSSLDDEDDSAEDCQDEKGLQKDYCLKDNAIDEGDYKMCDTISDAGIKKTCQNRITEDLLEEQQDSRDLEE